MTTPTVRSSLRFSQRTVFLAHTVDTSSDTRYDALILTNMCDSPLIDVDEEPHRRTNGDRDRRPGNKRYCGVQPAMD